MIFEKQSYSGKIFIGILFLFIGCAQQQKAKMERQLVARVGDNFLYSDELKGIVPEKTTRDDSTARLNAYVNSWVRKQLLIQEAMKNIQIDQAEVERKILDYRYSLIGYEYVINYIRQHLNSHVDEALIAAYYKEHADNFILKQNIIQGSYIKVPKTAPRTKRIKKLMLSTKKKDMTELKSYCSRFSTAFYLSDTLWIEFDKLAVNSPLRKIPDKIQFLRNNNFYETGDLLNLYFLKVDAYKITDNISPLEFVRQDIKNIILNKRKVELAKQLEDEIYKNAEKRKDFEIHNQ